MAVRHTLVGDLDPRAVSWMQQAIDEHDRRSGQLARLVLRMLARGEDPTEDDLTAAFNEAPADETIHQYIVTRYIQKTTTRQVGRKPAPRTTWETVLIRAFYQHQLHKAKLRQRAGLISAPATRAKAITAKKFGISTREVATLIAPLSLLKSPLK